MKYLIIAILSVLLLYYFSTVVGLDMALDLNFILLFVIVAALPIIRLYRKQITSESLYAILKKRAICVGVLLFISRLIEILLSLSDPSGVGYVSVYCVIPLLYSAFIFLCLDIVSQD